MNLLLDFGIIDEVKAKQWKVIANQLGIAKREIDIFEQMFQHLLK